VKYPLHQEGVYFFSEKIFIKILGTFVETRKPVWLLGFLDEKNFIFFKKMLDSEHASMVLYIQEVREKQNKENKNHDARTRKESGGPRGDNSRTRSEPGGETKKEGSGSNSPPDEP